MERRKPYTRVEKTNEIRADHVRGMGDVVFKGFQCLNNQCTEFIFVRKDELAEEFEIVCPTCGFIIASGEETKFYDYELLDLRNKSVIESGPFAILHDDYIDEALEYKYCIVCNCMKPLAFFDRHASRKSKRQGECRLCKHLYNSIKNQTRLTDQHREASQKRRMYLDFSGSGKINSSEILNRFDYKCFKCGKDLTNAPRSDRALDHTLPALYLWPLTTENATLLCRDHNGEKAEKWPGAYYTDSELKRLSVLTGISYELLSGPPLYNPEAIALLKSHEVVDKLLAKYVAYIEEIIKLRNRILAHENFDFFEYSKTISPEWVQIANNEYRRITNRAKGSNTEPDIDET
jgi:hypothetical protein